MLHGSFNYDGVSRVHPWHYEDNRDNIKIETRITFVEERSELEP